MGLHPCTQPTVREISSSMIPSPVIAMMSKYIYNPEFERVIPKNLYTTHAQIKFTPSTKTKALQLELFTKRITSHPEQVIERILDKITVEVCPEEEKVTTEHIAQAAYILDTFATLKFNTIRFKHVVSHEVCDPHVYAITVSALVQVLSMAAESEELIYRMHQLYLHPTQTVFHKYLPTLRCMEPTPMQKEVIGMACDLRANKRLIVLRDYPGSGKTTTVVALAGMYHTRGSPVIVFACPIGPVLDEIAVAIGSLRIPFTSVVARYNIHGSITRLDVVMYAKQSAIILITPDALLHLTSVESKVNIDPRLKLNPEMSYVLFYDEAYADNRSDLVQAVLQCWPWHDAIISSATLPPEIYIPNYAICEVNNSIPEIECVSSCIPLCQNRSDVVALKGSLKRSILSRYFTRDDVIILRRELQIDSPFPLILRNVQPAGVLEEWDRVLEIISSRDDAEITYLFNKLQRHDVIMPPTIVGTSGFYSFQEGYGIIYGTSNPLVIAQEALDGMMLREDQHTFLSEVMSRHHHIEATAENKIAQLNKSTKNKNSGALNRSLQEISRITDQINGNKKVNIPAQYVVGTAAHRDKHTCGHVSVRSVDVITILQDLSYFDLPAHVKLLCILGVGVHSRDLPDAFSTLIRDLFSHQQIKMIISDDSIAYGVNVPATQVMLDATCADFGISTILQYLARAGRKGMSDTATVYLAPNIQHLIHTTMLTP